MLEIKIYNQSFKQNTNKLIEIPILTTHHRASKDRSSWMIENNKK